MSQYNIKFCAFRLGWQRYVVHAFLSETGHSVWMEARRTGFVGEITPINSGIIGLNVKQPFRELPAPMRAKFRAIAGELLLSPIYSADGAKCE